MIAVRDDAGTYLEPALTEVQEFVFREVRLIDERKWDEWAALFEADGRYWVPAGSEPRDPRTEVSLVHERDFLRRLRIDRFRDELAPSLQPMPRSSHLVGNVLLDSFDPASGTCRVHARFLSAVFRRDELTLHAGEYAYALVPGDRGRYVMRSKTVLLVNRDGPLGDIGCYL